MLIMRTLLGPRKRACLVTAFFALSASQIQSCTSENPEQPTGNGGSPPAAGGDANVHGGTTSGGTGNVPTGGAPAGGPLSARRPGDGRHGHRRYRDRRHGHRRHARRAARPPAAPAPASTWWR